MNQIFERLIADVRATEANYQAAEAAVEAAHDALMRAQNAEIDASRRRNAAQRALWAEVRDAPAVCS